MGCRISVGMPLIYKIKAEDERNEQPKKKMYSNKVLVFNLLSQ